MKIIAKALWAVVGLVVLFTFGCASPRVLPQGPLFNAPGFDEAAPLVWASYKMNKPIPPVLWVLPAGLNCEDGTGFTAPDGVPASLKGKCLGGLTTAIPTNPPVVNCTIALPDGEPLSRGALAHEFKHAALFYLFGDVDTKHVREDWRPLGECGPCAYMTPPSCGRCGSVDAANELLQRHGQ